MLLLLLLVSSLLTKGHLIWKRRSSFHIHLGGVHGGMLLMMRRNV
jgi:hypothetical protein